MGNKYDKILGEFREEDTGSASLSTEGVSYETIFPKIVATSITITDTTLLNIGVSAITGQVIILVYLQTLNLPNLTTITSLANFYFGSLTSLLVPVLTTVGSGFYLVSTQLTSLDLSSLTTCPSIGINNNSVLASLILSDTIDTLSMDFTINALDTTSVDGILLSVDTAGYSTGTLDLSGGTNSTPTDGVDNANYVSLVGKGWTVTIN